MLGMSIISMSGIEVKEQSITLVHVSPALEKAEVERCEMDAYQAAAAKNFPRLICTSIKEGRNPPDFVVERDGKTLGVDLSAFAWSASRRNSAKFREIKEYLREAYAAGRLRQCAGLHIQVKFNSDKFPNLDGNEGLRTALDEMIGVFETYVMDSDEWQSTLGDDWIDGIVKNPFPMSETGMSRCGVVEWYVSGNGAIVSSFGAQCGFEIFHDAVLWVTPDDIRQRLDEIVAKHDKKVTQGIDELVIVAGGPDKYGDGLLEENMVASIYVSEWGGQISEPQNIARVVLLQWQTGRINVLYERD